MPGNPKIGAFILAAGEGRRLRPATFVRPKAMVPFCGIPLIELAASCLEQLHPEGIVVNASYQGERLQEFCLSLSQRYGWDLRVSQEHALLNHGGGLRQGIRLLPDAEHILVHNVDIVTDFDLNKLLEYHLAQDADVTAFLIPGKGKQSVSLNSDGSIACFRDSQHGTCTFAGIHIFRRDILQYLPPDDPAPDIIDCYHAALAHGRRVLGFLASPETYWSDIGTIGDYIRSHGEITDCALSAHPLLRQAQSQQAQRRFELELKGITCTGALGLGQGLTIPAGTHLHNVVLWDYTTLPRPLLYADGIFTGGDVPLPAPVTEQRQPDRRLLATLDIKPQDCTTTALAKQGSGRRYTRIQAKGKSYVWCAYNPERRENAGFAAISDFLSRLGIRVPRVLYHLPDAFELITEDLGQSDLQLTSGPLLQDYLFQVVEQIARLHVLGDQAARLEELPLQKGFTKGLYDWERDYFRENLLERFLHKPELWAGSAAEYCRLRSQLLRQPLVPIHRDLQSANIKVRNGQVWLIDFQGMRLGCAAYDLASLLYDPYQCHPRDLRLAVWREYCRQVSSLGGIPPEDQILHLAACQRLMQALGAYGKLWLKDGLDWYRQFIVPGLKMLGEACAELPDFPAFRQMAAQALALAKERTE